MQYEAFSLYNRNFKLVKLSRMCIIASVTLASTKAFDRFTGNYKGLMWNENLNNNVTFKIYLKNFGKISDESIKTARKRRNFELHHEKTCLRGFQPGQTQTRLYSHRRWLDA